MNQTYHILKSHLHELGVKVPNSIIRHQLETPVGDTMRGISDALDSLNIENNVYNLPEEYLCELDYPYLMVLPHRKDIFVVVTNDREKKEALPDWEGVVLTARKTDKTPIYKYVWLRNVAEWFENHQIHIACIIFLVSLIINAFPDYMAICHIVISIIGLWISCFLLNKEYNGSTPDKYCKIGRIIDCEQVLESKGSHFLGFLNMSDLSFLFFSTQIFLPVFHNNWQSYSYLLNLVGCIFTLYSVVYQVVFARKICIYCMSINFMVWMDSFLLVLNHSTMSLNKPLLFLLSGMTSYMLLYWISRLFSLRSQNESQKSKVSVLYNRDLFDWFLSKERKIDNVDDKYTDVGGEDNGDVITMFVHPNCKNCKRVYRYVPELRKKTIVKLVSLDSDDTELREYCKRNQIKNIPTVVFNGKELPRFYGVEDLKYVI